MPYTFLQLIHTLSLHAAEFLHFFNAPLVTIFMFQHCRKFIIIGVYVNRENGHSLEKVTSQAPHFHFNNLHKPLFPWNVMA
jgi:hypothetical protein